MNTFRILHIGGLELDAENYQRKRGWLEATLPDLQKVGIDRAVVCGSLTRHGDFSLLEKFLKPLADLFGERSHIVIVPGAHDPDQTFCEFHSGYFGQSFPCIGDDAISARRQRDITMIGMRLDKLAGGDAVLAAIGARLDQDVGTWGNHSDMHELRIAAMAVNPLELKSALFSLGQFSLWRQHVDLILCGTTGIPLIPVQPFAKFPTIIGIPTSRGLKDSWNVVSLRLPPTPRDLARPRIQLELKTYENGGSISSPSFEYSTSSFNASPAQIASVLICKEKLLPRLDEVWAAGTATVIEVSGYGDVWKEIISEGLQIRGRVGSHNIVLETFHIGHYPAGDSKTWGESEDIELVKQINDWHSSLRTHEPTPVALVIDEAFIAGQPYNSNYLDEMKKHLASFFFQHKLRIIYLSSSLGAVRPSGSKRIVSIRLDPIGEKTLEEFLILACCELPIRRKEIGRLTGGYVGFVKLLIDELRKHYRQIPGDLAPESWSFGRAVLQACSDSQPLRKESEVFDAWMRLVPSGRAIIDAFLDAMCKKLGKNTAHLEQLIEGEVSLTEAFVTKKRLGAGMRELTDLGIVSHKVGTQVYELRERIPFLVRFARAHEPQVVFLSHDERDRDKIRLFKEQLENENIGNWAWRDATSVQQGLPIAIEQQLRSCDIVVVLWTHHSVDSSLVIEEARSAMRIPGQFKLINWFDQVVPASHTPMHNTSVKLEDSRGWLISPILTEFSSALGRESLNDVVTLIKDNLLPVPYCLRPSRRRNAQSKESAGR